MALSPTDTQVIDSGKGNASEWNSRVQAVETPSPEQWSNYKQFSKINLDNWTSLSNIAHQVKGSQ